MKLAVGEILLDVACQPRSEINGFVVDDYAEAMAAGVVLPPVVVFKDGEGRYWCADGFHRVAAAEKAGLAEIAVDVRKGEKRDAILFSVGANADHGLRRTNADKRRAVETLLTDPEWRGWSDREIGRACRVDEKTVARYRPESDSGNSGVRKRVDRHGNVGTINVSKIGKRTAAAALQAGGDLDETKTLQLASEIRSTRTEERRTERTQRLAEIADAETPAVGSLTRRYPVLYADPPWRYEHAASVSREIENQYPTMALDDICELPIDKICTDDAILFCWATSPKLTEAIEVIEAWGFTYRTCAVWDKERIGMGYYYRQQHELLLICTRGDMPAPAPSARPPSVIRAVRDEKHSAKPTIVYEQIEAMYPDLPRIELFARNARAGWDAWGNQA
jgi:N6-adenosine-specific RNA methylase IME4